MQNVNNILQDLKEQQRRLESLINSTPTSDLRNTLTEANIHLMLAVDTLVGVAAKGIV